MSHKGALSTPNRYITAHSPSGTSIFSTAVAAPVSQNLISRHPPAQGSSPPPDAPPATSSLASTVPRLPACLAANADTTAYLADLAKSPTLPVPYVMPDGTAFHYIELAPGTVTAMHQTVSIDHDICLDGEVELILDGGETRLIRKGDMVVQRGTMHAWRNPSNTEWARFVAVVQPIVPLVVNGEELKLEFHPPPEVKTKL